MSVSSPPVGPVVSSTPSPSPSPPAPPLPPITGCGLPTIRFFQSYLWKFLVTDLNCVTITALDRLASNRRVTKTLNDALELSLDVPSDNIRVNLPYTDFDPKVDEGTRLLIGFRYEGPSVWVNRANGIIMSAHDFQSGDIPTTSVTAFDPWRYLDYLPVINLDTVGTPPVPTPGPMYWSSNFLGNPKPSVFAGGPGGYGWKVNEMIINQLELADSIYNGTTFGVGNGLFLDYGQTAFYGGTIEDISFPSGIPGYTQPNGTSIGDFLRGVCGDPGNGLGYCDLVITPIYDPVNRPGLIGELSILARAGTQRDTAVMSWDRLPRTLTAFDRLQDGTQRANKIQNYHSRGGPPVTLKLDTASIAKYKTYYQSRFFPTQGGQVQELENLALAQLLLRNTGIETIAISPTPERAKVPFLDYDVGDTVPVWATKNLRKPVFEYQRVMQIPIDISDEALETVTQLTVKKPVVLPAYAGPTMISASVGDSGGATRPRRRSTLSSLPGP